MSRLKSLMEELFEANQAFTKELNAWQSGKTRQKRKEKSVEPKSITAARDKFLIAYNRLFAQLDTLYAQFSSDQVVGIDEIIDFLAVDIPCFRCGYEKEKLLTKLKALQLNSSQKQKLREIALSLCQGPHFRREIGDWSRLMIKLADSSFISDLQEISESSNYRIKSKAKWMLEKILHHRKDLADEL